MEYFKILFGTAVINLNIFAVLADGLTGFICRFGINCLLYILSLTVFNNVLEIIVIYYALNTILSFDYGLKYFLLNLGKNGSLIYIMNYFEDITTKQLLLLLECVTHPIFRYNINTQKIKLLQLFSRIILFAFLPEPTSYNLFILILYIVLQMIDTTG